MKVVINRRHGTYALSEPAQAWLREHGVALDSPHPEYTLDATRTHPALVACVETLGEAASADMARLVVIDVPDDVTWTIAESEGLEWVAEAHRTWGQDLW